MQLGHIQDKAATKVLASVVQFDTGQCAVSSLDPMFEPSFMAYPNLDLLSASITANQKLVWDKTWLPVLVTALLTVSDDALPSEVMTPDPALVQDVARAW